MAEIRALALSHPSYGYLRLTHLLHRKGLRINKKRVYRLYRAMNLQKPVKRAKKRLLKPYDLVKAAHINHIWAVDFCHDRLETGSQFRIFRILDEYSRRLLAQWVNHSIRGTDCARLLTQAVKRFGRPEILRSDGGPEFKSISFQTTLANLRIRHTVIEPGKPFQNPFAESAIGKFREECLDAHTFETLIEAQAICHRWAEEYNHCRPHSSLGNRTPLEVWDATLIAQSSDNLPESVDQQSAIHTGTPGRSLVC